MCAFFSIQIQGTYDGLEVKSMDLTEFKKEYKNIHSNKIWPKKNIRFSQTGEIENVHYSYVESITQNKLHSLS